MTEGREIAARAGFVKRVLSWAARPSASLHKLSADKAETAAAAAVVSGVVTGRLMMARPSRNQKPEGIYHE